MLICSAVLGTRRPSGPGPEALPTNPRRGREGALRADAIATFAKASVLAGLLAVAGPSCSSGYPINFGTDLGPDLPAMTPDAPPLADVSAVAQLGDPCASNADCGAGQICLTGASFPAGLCSVRCPVGVCPELASCTPAATGPDGGIDEVCLPSCASDQDCRSGYTCRRQLCVAAQEMACATGAPGPSTFTAAVAVSRSDGTLLEAEPTLAVRSESQPGGRLLAAAYITLTAQGVQTIGTSYSTDGGQSFTRGPWLAVPGTQQQSDPVLTTAPDGTVHLVWIGYDASAQGEPLNAHIAHATSTDGASWSPPQTIGQSATNQPLDKPWITSGPDGRLAVTWAAYDGGTSSIQLAEAPAGGTFGTPSAAVPAEGGEKNLAMAAYAPDGTLAIAYFSPSALGRDILVTVRPAGAASFDPPIQLTQGGESSFEQPSIAFAPDGSRLFVSWIRNDGGLTAPAEGGPTEVVLSRSDDQGAHFLEPVKVNDDPAGCAPHLRAQLLLDPLGQPQVVYYDGRYGADQGRIVISGSTDGGATFGPARVISDQPVPIVVARDDHRWIGDYLFAARLGTQAYVVWTDGHQDRTSHIYFARGPIAAP